MYTRVFYDFDNVNSAANPQRKAGNFLGCNRQAVNSRYEVREEFVPVTIINGINTMQE
jgi:hypothetical protein